MFIGETEWFENHFFACQCWYIVKKYIPWTLSPTSNKYATSAKWDAKPLHYSTNLQAKKKKKTWDQTCTNVGLLDSCNLYQIKCTVPESVLKLAKPKSVELQYALCAAYSCSVQNIEVSLYEMHIVQNCMSNVHLVRKQLSSIYTLLRNISQIMDLPTIYCSMYNRCWYNTFI